MRKVQVRVCSVRPVHAWIDVELEEGETDDDARAKAREVFYNEGIAVLDWNEEHEISDHHDEVSFQDVEPAEDEEDEPASEEEGDDCPICKELGGG